LFEENSRDYLTKRIGKADCFGASAADITYYQTASYMTTAILDMHQPLSKQRKRSLEATLKADAGVVSVGSSRHLPRLLMVGYNAARTSSGRIVKQVSGAGVPVQMVGCA